jgi:tRNA-intron endonuclease
MINAYFVGDRVRTSSPLAYSMYEKSRWGEKKNGFIEFSGVETVHLVEKGKMEVFSGKKQLSYDKLLNKFKKNDKKIETKLVVFSDLRDKGYVVKTALKFGAEFRVYEKGVKPGEDHAKWIAYCVRENEKISWHDFAAKNRVAHSTKKNLLICVMDEESGVSYYEVGWRKI